MCIKRCTGCMWQYGDWCGLHEVHISAHNCSKIARKCSVYEENDNSECITNREYVIARRCRYEPDMRDVYNAISNETLAEAFETYCQTPSCMALGDYSIFGIIWWEMQSEYGSICMIEKPDPRIKEKTVEWLSKERRKGKMSTAAFKGQGNAH